MLNSDLRKLMSDITSASYAGFDKSVIKDKSTVVENKFGYTLVWKDDPKAKETVVKITVGGYTLVGFAK